MLIKLRVRADTLSDMRDFLADADVDIGCTPLVVSVGDRYSITVISDQREYNRLVTQRSGNVDIDVLEDVTAPTAALRMVASGNRFQGGGTPRGLGTKE